MVAAAVNHETPAIDASSRDEIAARPEPSWLRRLAHGRDAHPSDFRISRELFLRLLGAVHVIAFTSLWMQVCGLVGSRGILPVSEYLSFVHDRLGAQAYWELPTLCWFDSSDGFLIALCAAGTALGGLLVLGIAPLPVLALLWASYLSLSIAGQEFLSFQWDILLLETTFMALFIAPVCWLMKPGRCGSASRAGMLLLWLLLFKLTFLSGATKLLSGDVTWRDGTAMTFHFYTQPIPAWTSWYAQQLPVWMQRSSTIPMFAIEMLAPLFIFAPRRLRHIAAGSMILLQLLIALTGNYGFFNLLAIILCVALIDDHAWRSMMPRRWRSKGPMESPARRQPHNVLSTVRIAIVSLIAVISILTMIREMSRTARNDKLPAVVSAPLDWFSHHVLRWAQPVILDRTDPFRTISGYGLFRVMTTQRPELVIEGSDDGVTWKAYEFRWKPGDVTRSPRFVAPYHPRLDWQMWFAALNPAGSENWLQSLLNRILEGEPSVLALMDANPFPHAPPRIVRLVLYRYQFTTSAEKRATGAWWKRVPVGRSDAMSLPRKRSM